MSTHLELKLYGAQRCHKTNYYQTFLDSKNLKYQFLDVEVDDNSAKELRALYGNRKLNFPTLTLGNKKLRNPTEKELTKWLAKLK
ncbi:glutaredoxin family protein [uncultured Winogradskyella sp.]|uniref:glutaredoxin family protein n=1 Tax=uncultured Winogradskyella sp. TaxID=395353 RepID=UPI0030DB286A|tara:strand:- start:80426 stop:80680 length:255 start_codon:yes stop_codon:yes gene_type:complete